VTAVTYLQLREVVPVNAALPAQPRVIERAGIYATGYVVFAVGWAVVLLGSFLPLVTSPDGPLTDNRVADQTLLPQAAAVMLLLTVRGLWRRWDSAGFVHLTTLLSFLLILCTVAEYEQRTWEGLMPTARFLEGGSAIVNRGSGYLVVMTALCVVFVAALILSSRIWRARHRPTATAARPGR
jgi:hypothetical protein